VIVVCELSVELSELSFTTTGAFGTEGMLISVSLDSSLVRTISSVKSKQTNKRESITSFEVGVLIVFETLEVVVVNLHQVAEVQIEKTVLVVTVAAVLVEVVAEEAVLVEVETVEFVELEAEEEVCVAVEVAEEVGIVVEVEVAEEAGVVVETEAEIGVGVDFVVLVVKVGVVEHLGSKRLVLQALEDQ